MKKSIFRLSYLTMVFLSLLALTSCEKDDVDDYGSAHLKVVNASTGSSAKVFYLLGERIIDGLEYTDYSDYIIVNSGNRLSASFTDQSNGSPYAEGEIWLANTKRYTVYLAGSGSDARVKQFEDDLSTPPSGKARIKFIHLSEGLSSNIRIKDNAGDELVNNLTRNLESSYRNIDPGSFSFSVYGTASGDLIKRFEIDNIEAGKNYTIYFSGTSSSIEAHKVNY